MCEFTQFWLHPKTPLVFYFDIFDARNIKPAAAIFIFLEAPT
jgi:hypothetical protein